MVWKVFDDQLIYSMSVIVLRLHSGVVFCLVLNFYLILSGELATRT